MSCRQQGDHCVAVIAAETMHSGSVLIKNSNLLNQAETIKNLLNCALAPRKNQFSHPIMIDNLNLASAFGFLNQKRSSPEFDAIWKLLLRPQTPPALIAEAAKQADSVDINKRLITILLARVLHQSSAAQIELEKLAQNGEVNFDLRQRAKLALFALAYEQNPTISVPAELFPPRRASSQLSAPITWLLDVDGTLYSKHNPVLREIIKRISGYVSEKMNLSLEEGTKFTDEQYFKYGSTIAGLMINHPENGGNPLEFMEHAHDVKMVVDQKEKDDVQQVKQLRGRKMILTNASTLHARRVWQQVTNQNLTYKIACDGVDMLPYSKPHPYAYLVALHNINTHPSECVMVDDSPLNTAAALKLGMRSVLVGSEIQVPPAVASCGINSVGDLSSTLPHLVLQEANEGG